MIWSSIQMPRRDTCSPMCETEPCCLFLHTECGRKFAHIPTCFIATYHVWRMSALRREMTWITCFTWAGGTPGKRNRFREALLWNDPPEYFDGRFVAYTPDVPPQMLSAAVPPNNREHKQSMKEAEPQFALIHHQFAQVGLAAMTHKLQKP
jgi:hypothetical protein